jgi:nascent polypeptide-associated complex subunit beta
VAAEVKANAIFITGKGEWKQLTELMPDILDQLGPESVESLKNIAENYASHMYNADQGIPDDIPDLLDFEQASLD